MANDEYRDLAHRFAATGSALRSCERPTGWKRERDSLAARVAALEEQRDEALKALEIREDELQWPYYPYERIREARRILSGDGGSA